MMTVNQVKHLEMIQRVVERLARNSAMYRIWAFVAFMMILSLSHKGHGHLDLFLVVPLIIFWGFDAYYLRMERLYRGLFDKIRKLGATETDFTMTVNDEGLDKVVAIARALFSKTIVWLYMPLIAVAVVKSILT